MLRKAVIITAGAVAIGLAVFWFLTIPATIPASALSPRNPDLANGKTMFDAGGCSSCHAVPGQDDKTRLGGGLGLKSPFGTFYVPNISPDPKDGIGGWTEAQFLTAMVKGTSPSGTHYFPAFPYTSYQRMKYDDARDLFAHLKTLPAVQGRVRDHVVPFPFNIRRTLGGWKFLFLDGVPFRPNNEMSAQWNRGAYLVNGLSHCAECHSPRNFLGGIVSRQRFAGGPNPEGEGWIPNITQKTLASWSEADIVEMLISGQTPNDRVAGRMRAVVENTSKLSADDQAAIAAYIKLLPAVDGPPRPRRAE